MAPLFLSSLLAWGQSPKPDEGKKEASIFKIALDAGHGGDDSGAIGAGKIQEKNIALALVLAMSTALEKAGFSVILTRSDDTFIPLWDRARIANEAGADLFLSLHLNAARARAAKGSEVYFLSLDAGDADAAEVAAQENRGAQSPSSAPENVIASILDDLAQKAYLQDSERLAIAVQNQLNRLGGIKERGVKQAPFVVLRSAAMPAVLVETGFISNPKEAAKLKDPAFLGKVADSIAIGIRRFLSAGAVMPRRKALESKPEPSSKGAPS